MWRQSSTAVSTRAYGIRVVVNNSDDLYIERVLSILSNLGVSNWKTSRRTSSIGTKDVCEIKIGELDSIVKVLSATIEFMTSKKSFAEAALALALMRKQSREDHGQRALWTDEECAFAERIRSKFMPNALAYGEALAGRSDSMLKVIPSEAMGSVDSTMEPLESRDASNASSNRPQECPAPLEGEDVLRSSRKLESWDKEPSEDIATV